MVKFAKNGKHIFDKLRRKTLKLKKTVDNLNNKIEAKDKQTNDLYLRLSKKNRKIKVLKEEVRDLKEQNKHLVHQNEQIKTQNQRLIKVGNGVERMLNNSNKLLTIFSQQFNLPTELQTTLNEAIHETNEQISTNGIHTIVCLPADRESNRGCSPCSNGGYRQMAPGCASSSNG